MGFLTFYYQREKKPLNPSLRPQGHITINHLQLYMIPPPSPPLLSYLELHPASLYSHTFPQPEGLCPGHPPTLPPVSLFSPLPWHPRTSLHVPLAVRDPEVN